MNRAASRSAGSVARVALVAFAAMAAIAGTSGSAWAQAGAGGNGAVAQELFNQARALMAAGKYEGAYPKLAESQRLDPGMGTEFNLAECEQKLGKTASAWAHYLEVADAARVAGQGARERVARTRASQLAVHLGRLSITPRFPASGIEIRRDGVLVGPAQYGVAVPVDPGEHPITATAPGRKSWERTVRVTDGQTMPLEVPRLEELPAPPLEPAPAIVTRTASPDPDSAQRGRTQRIVGIAVAAAGVVGIGIGAGFGVASKSKHDDADPHCDGSSCDASGVSLRNDAIHAGNVSTVAFIAGAAALAGGGVLFFTAPHASSPTAALSTAPFVGPHTGGLALAGRF